MSTKKDEIKLCLYGITDFPERFAQEIKNGGACAACGSTTLLVEISRSRDGKNMYANVDCGFGGCSQPLGQYTFDM